ncbi:MAG: hypothetical protein ACPGO3_12620 [Magnetospiraceae bacterium]
MQPLAPPLFSAFDVLGVNGRRVARLANVSGATVSKWRNGHRPTPPAIQVFLTLLLTNWAIELESGRRARFPAIIIDGDRWADLRRALSAQESVNAELDQAAAREGSRLFRSWLAGRRVGVGPSLDAEGLEVV